MSKDPGYSDSKVDSQGSKLRNLETKLNIAITQIEGLLLALKTHGSNIDSAFLIQHYEKVLDQIKVN